MIFVQAVVYSKKRDTKGFSGAGHCCFAYTRGYNHYNFPGRFGYWVTVLGVRSWVRSTEYFACDLIEHGIEDIYGIRGPWPVPMKQPTDENFALRAMPMEGTWRGNPNYPTDLYEPRLIGIAWWTDLEEIPGYIRVIVVPREMRYAYDNQKIGAGPSIRFLFILVCSRDLG